MAKFKVGDKVKFRKDLIEGQRYNGWLYSHIKGFAGIATITEVGGFPEDGSYWYHTDVGKSKATGNPWCYTDDMLTRVVTAHRVTLSRDEQKKVIVAR